MHGIVKKQFVQLDGPVAAHGPRASTASQRCSSSVRLLRIEGVVRALEVTCTCGETTVVELEYGSPKE